MPGAVFRAGACSKIFGEVVDCLSRLGKVGLYEREYSGRTGSSFSMTEVVSKMASSGTFEGDKFGIGRLLDNRSLRGVSPRSMLDVLNLTLPDGDRGGVIILSSGSSRIG